MRFVESSGVVKVLPVVKVSWVLAEAYHTQLHSGAGVAVRVTEPLPQRETEDAVGAVGLAMPVTVCEASLEQPSRVAVTE